MQPSDKLQNRYETVNWGCANRYQGPFTITVAMIRRRLASSSSLLRGLECSQGWTSLASPLTVVSSRRPPYPYISLSSVVIVSPLTVPGCELRVYLSSDPWISIRLAFRQTASLLSTPPIYTLCHHRLPILLHQVHLRH
jgi:hypothetical protein